MTGVGEQLSLLDSPAAARATDPSTSHRAAAANRPLRVSQKVRLLSVYANDDAVGGDGFTDEEAGDRVGLDHVAATRRLSELRKKGYISLTGEERPTRTGCMSMVCTITAAGHLALALERR